MVEIMKQELRKSLEMCRIKYVETGKEMNVISEVVDLFARIILACGFG